MPLLLIIKAVITASGLKSGWYARPQLAAYLIIRHELQVSAHCSNAIMGFLMETICLLYLFLHPVSNDGIK